MAESGSSQQRPDCRPSAIPPRVAFRLVCLFPRLLAGSRFEPIERCLAELVGRRRSQHRQRVGGNRHQFDAALQLDSPIFGGCSNGGRIAYEYAARYPEATDVAILLEAPISVTDPPLGMRLFQKVGIGLIATVGPKRSYDVLRMLRSLRGTDDPYADRYVPGLGMRKAEYIDDAAAMMDADEQLELMRAERRGVDLSAVTAPTLVLTGDDPAERFADSADTLVEQIPEATRGHIPDAGHGAHMDNPVAFNATVREFCDEEESLPKWATVGATENSELKARIFYLLVPACCARTCLRTTPQAVF